MKEYETNIGLEIHVQLKTESKMFCTCDNYSHNVDPNTNVCEICMGFPGVLPVANKKAIEWTVLLGKALNSKISPKFNFERKNYFYPDLPKAYQISSATNPPVIGGYLNIFPGGREEKIRIHHIHLEEDAGKLVHNRQGKALVDLNRAGTPLVEIVTEPDLHSAEEAGIFARSLRSLVRHLGISNANMEEGNMRFDINVSVKKKGDKDLGTKVEVKNLNSFKMLERAIIFEKQRQRDLLDEGKKIIQETRGWDDNKCKTLPQRSKEEAHDYRYFPEPDIPLIETKGIEEKMKSKLPELPQKKAKRFENEYQLSKSQANSVADDVEIANYFEETLNYIEKAVLDVFDKKIYAKKVLSWMMELTYNINESNLDFSGIKITPKNMAEIIISIENGNISGKQGKDVFSEMFETGKSARRIIKEKGMKQMGDKDMIDKYVKEVILENPKTVQDFKAGKEKALAYLVGKIMQRTKGEANPKIVNEILRENIK